MLFRLRSAVLVTAPVVAVALAGVTAVPATAATTPTGAATVAPTLPPAPAAAPRGTDAPTLPPTTAAAPSGTVAPVPSPPPTRTVRTPTPTPTPTPIVTVPTPIRLPVPAPTWTPVPTPTPTPTPTPVVPYPTAASLDHTVGRSANTRTLWLTGTNLTNVSSVLIGGAPTDKLTVVSATRIGFAVSTAPEFQPTTASISLVAASDGAVLPTSLSFQWVVQNRVDRQMRYAFSHWNDFASARYGYLPGNDCANFASQTLRARGWKPGSVWYDKGQGDWTGTWVSSTAMSGWLAKRPDLATHLIYRQRDQVRVGDIVQFNWEGVGTWWDHTAVVSKVVVLPNGRHDIRYVAHTNNTRFGGSTEWLAHHVAKLRIQFWRLNR